MKTISAYPKITEAILKVSCYQDGNLAGWLVHPKLEAPFKVRSLSELVLSLNDLLKQEDVLIGCRAKESYRTDENEVLDPTDPDPVSGTLYMAGLSPLGGTIHKDRVP